MLMSSSDKPATLIYGPNGFRVVRPGHYVPCAVTGAPIPLEELRYWSVDLQEPYASAEISTRRALGLV
ncbi:DUF2093 domain-containing protein [Alteraurantiacibacter buctensis]|uniref:DUF2093 domain-containing protein n=1 Tax=Alteraurantiacibacter buctensis TaxID=1503981 RepID=A0A844YSD2_9SPHN|nr:DUF2093 domain-containing protein [Alteraurantiacibacter buctensis]MXO70459.1 DUF2093 domain-containing protein [Alteraurantiacibacter buctensis]